MNFVCIQKERGRGAARTKVLILFFGLFFVSCLTLVISTASAAVVEEIQITGLHSIGQDELLYLLDIGKGDAIDAERVRLGIKRAFLKGIFEDITVDTTDGEKTKVFIHVREKDYIRNICVKGEHELSGGEIMKLFPLKEGLPLGCGALEKAVDDLRPKLISRGFPHVVINAAVERLEEPYKVDVSLRVDTGKPEKIKRIDIPGGSADISSVMKLSEGDIFDRTRLEKDIERIRAYYRDKKYFKPVVGPYTYTDGILSIPVDPGRRLTITIEGNDDVSTKKLMAEMPFFEARDFSPDLVEEAVQRMLSVCHEQGYPFARIEHVVTTEGNLIRVTFSVQEGKFVEIGKITFIGSTLSEERLREIISLKEGKRYNPDLLGADRESLNNFYISLGYLTADVGEFKTSYEKSRHRMDISVSIHEGTKTTIESIAIVGATRVGDDTLRKIIGIKKGDAYNDVDISNARYRIIDFYGGKGFPNATVSVDRQIDEEKANITFNIDEGSVVFLGKTIVTGNRQTKYAVIKRELVQTADQPFDFAVLAKERQKLYKLGLFSDINVEVIDSYDDTKDVVLRLKEGRAGAVEFGAGYGEYDRYRGYIDLSYRNLMGMNRQGSLRFELSSLEERYILQYYEPWFLGVPLPFRAYVLGEDKREINIDTRETRYRLTRHTVTAGFEKKLSEHIRSELFYEFSVVNTYDVKPDVILSREDTGTLVISGMRLGLIYDTRDNPFDPQKGVVAGIAAKATSPLLFSETDFFKMSFYGNIYHKLVNRVVLAVSLKGGIAKGYRDTNELPLVERFFLGGSTTVRGYDQDFLGPKGSDGNPTGGNAFLMENLEVRTSLGRGIGLVTFLDGGNVWLKISDMALRSMKFTSGVGLRYDTPVGPLRLDYGVKLRRERGESAGEIYFSIGHAF